MRRRNFIRQVGLASTALALMPEFTFAADGKESDFAKHLKPIGRRLEMEATTFGATAQLKAPMVKYTCTFRAGQTRKKWVAG